jgi:hypothetical protein
MDIKDAEYQDWKEDSYNYNKPKISFFTKKPLNNTVILAEDWWLKPMLTKEHIWSHHKDSYGGYICDYKSIGRDVRVVGTELQLYNLFCRMSDEKGWQIKDEWQTEVKNNYLSLYIKNNLKPLIINLI